MKQITKGITKESMNHVRALLSDSWTQVFWEQWARYAFRTVQQKAEENSSQASTLPFVGIRQRAHLLLISPLHADK
jgi:hypothetical protein